MEVSVKRLKKIHSKNWKYTLCGVTIHSLQFQILLVQRKISDLYSLQLKISIFSIDPQESLHIGGIFTLYDDFIESAFIQKLQSYWFNGESLVLLYNRGPNYGSSGLRNKALMLIFSPKKICNEFIPSIPTIFTFAYL